MLVLLLAACGWFSEPAPAPEPAPAEVRASVPPAPIAPPSAPTRAIYGLTIGASSAADIEAWLAERSLSCAGKPSARRTTTRYACSGKLDPKLLPDRTIKGELHDILLVRGDAGPLRHFSSGRRYSLPADAIVDYTTAVAAIQGALGAPTRAGAQPTEAQFSGMLARFSTLWRFADLEVVVTLMKANGPYIAVTETWDLPGAESEDEVRAMPHGDPGSDPHANPHGDPHATNPHAAPTDAGQPAHP